jgi:ABC-type polysaccharide/polyol phosphate transport system ATPase subunit
VTGSRISYNSQSDADGLAVDVSDASVRYRVPHERIPTFKEFALRWLRGGVVYQDLLALDRVTLRIRRGEAVGIVGRNGAGKTTLLKVIARVLRPPSGSVSVHGRLAPLLELGAGFDPELSGRENVFLNGAILGRSRAEMVSRLPSIIDFSELADFIDAPLRTYSTGMVARLGFAVATDVDPDVLLIDEVLSVGDLAFARKCLDRIHAFRARGATLVLVSHSPDTVRSLCERAAWLRGGHLVADGPADEVLKGFVNDSVAPMPLAAVR